ncbi:MAG: hypothetical protein ACXACR_14640 [Candidatus Hodarchaeales archaeon]|jgi:hypothetical protein
MKIKSLGSNITEVETKDLRILVSYSTPVAMIRLNGNGRLKTDKFHSKTTSRHINDWFLDHGLDPKRVPTNSQFIFDQLLE